MRGLGAGRAFAASGGLLCWRAADHPRQSANCGCVSQWSVDDHHAIAGDQLVALLESPSTCSEVPFRPLPLTADLRFLPRGVSPPPSTPLRARKHASKVRRAQPVSPGQNALPRTPDFSRWGPALPKYNQSRCSVEKSASPLYTAS